ncbi:MAG: TPM domain-containing protein [Bdellovibrionales bacterium]|nr:TPM domain-containing protein [Bdellovibrionales bacterium]
MRFFLPLILLLSLNVWGAEIQIPALRAPVMDEAGFLSEQEEQDLNNLAYEIHTNQGPQITIFTVNDMQENEIEEFSIRVVEKWQLGSKEKDNGILVVIAKAERKMRIEVGQGIEGEITDFEANRYITSILTPYFKQSDLHGGLKLVLQDIARVFNIKVSEGRSFVRRATPGRSLSGPLVAALPFLIMILVLGQLLLGRKPFARGIFTGAGMAGVGAFMGAAGIVMIGFMFLMGLLIGMIGLQNLLFALAAGSGRGGFGGGGGFRGGGGGGSSWGGGGGGFSGGGSSGSW